MSVDQLITLLKQYAEKYDGRDRVVIMTGNDKASIKFCDEQYRAKMNNVVYRETDHACVLAPIMEPIEELTM